MTARSKHDLAYGCFLVPWAACLIAVTVPTDIGTTGFFVLMPLMIASLAAIPIGVFYFVVFWRNGGLPLLSILTIIMIAVVLTAMYGQLARGSVADSSGAPYGMLLLIGISVLIIEACWWLFRRRSYPV